MSQQQALNLGRIITPEVRPEPLAALRQIIVDCQADVLDREGAAPNAQNLAQWFAEIDAMIAALAGILGDHLEQHR